MEETEGAGMTSLYLCRLFCVRWAWTGLCSNPLCSSGSGVQLCCGGSWDKRLRSSSPTICTAPCWSDISGREGCSYTLRGKKRIVLQISVILRQINWWLGQVSVANTGGSFILEVKKCQHAVNRKLGLYLRTAIRMTRRPVMHLHVHTHSSEVFSLHY